MNTTRFQIGQVILLPLVECYPHFTLSNVKATVIQPHWALPLDPEHQETIWKDWGKTCIEAPHDITARCVYLDPDDPIEAWALVPIP